MSKKANASRVIVSDPAIQALVLFQARLEELFARWEPHKFQEELLISLLVERNEVTVAETGRQLGKTEAIIAAAGLWGQLVPGSQQHYMAPELKQARKILWDSGRIEAILPPSWIDDFKEKNSTVYFAGSKHCFLTIDGIDKFDKSRGLTLKDGVLYLDECRDMKEGAYETIKPALGVHRVPVVLTSTPPEDLYPDADNPKELHWFCQAHDEAGVREAQKALHATTYDNPHYPKALIEQQRERLYARGKGYIFEREYMGKRVEGKASRTWPMLVNDEVYVRPHEELMEELSRDKSKLKWFCMTDPAGASCWAWLFIALNPFTRKVYVLDEIYETEKGKMALGVMWPKAERIMAGLYSDLSVWRKYYDEAEKWFQNEIWQNYRVNFNPSKKQSRSKEEGYSLFSDMFLAHKVVFSDRCEHAYWEFKNHEDEDSSDHQVDNGRYFLIASNYSLPERAEELDNLSAAEKRFRAVTGIDKALTVTVNEQWIDKLITFH